MTGWCRCCRRCRACPTPGPPSWLTSPRISTWLPPTTRVLKTYWLFFFGNFPGDFLTLFSHKIFSSPHILTPVLARCAPSPTRHRHRHGHRRHHGAPHLHRRHQDAGLRRHQDAPWPAGALVPPPHPPLSSSASLSPPDPLRLPPGLLPPPLPLGPGDVGGGGEVFAKLKLGRVQVSKIVNETGLSISPSLFWQNA